MTDNSKQAVSSVKNLATLLKRTEQKSFTEFAYEELNLLDYPGEKDDYLLINPLVTLIDVRPKDG